MEELKDEVEGLGSETELYEELVGNENDVFEKVEGKLVDEMDVGDEGNNILGGKGNIGLNGSVDWMVVETIYDAVVSKWGMESLDVYANNWANSMASSISLRIVTLISSSVSWFFIFLDSMFASILLCFDSKNEIKAGSKTTILKLISDLLLNKEFSNFKSNSISCKLTDSYGNELTLLNEILTSKSSIYFFSFWQFCLGCPL